MSWKKSKSYAKNHSYNYLYFTSSIFITSIHTHTDTRTSQRHSQPPHLIFSGFLLSAHFVVLLIIGSTYTFASPHTHTHRGWEEERERETGVRQLQFSCSASVDCSAAKVTAESLPWCQMYLISIETSRHYDIERNSQDVCLQIQNWVSSNL